MTEQEFFQLLHRRLSQISVGSSAIRKQGASGLINTLRFYFETEISLEEFVNVLPIENLFADFLNRHTTNVLARFPDTAQSWGAARKGMNLFFREIVYSKFFSHRFSLPDDFNEFNCLVKYLEVPLDKEVAKGLKADTNEQLPNWLGIKRLTPLISEQYQHQATIIATQENIARVNLDLKYWRRSS